MRYKATIDIYVELPGEGDGTTKGEPLGSMRDAELADGISETMRAAIENSDGFMIDWSYTVTGDKFSYAEPFEGETPEEELQASFTD